MSEQKHTNTPWEASGEVIYAPRVGLEFSVRVADCSPAEEDNQEFESFVNGEPEANAAFIVRAVNAHDALIEFLTNARAHALAGDKDESYAELRGDFLGELLKLAEGKEV